MKSIPKQPRETDKDYLAFIRAQPCLVSDFDCIGDIVYHHTKGKMFDYHTVPLCTRHHVLGVHSMGCQTFQDIYGIDFKKEIERLNELYKITTKATLTPCKETLKET